MPVASAPRACIECAKTAIRARNLDAVIQCPRCPALVWSAFAARLSAAPSVQEDVRAVRRQGTPEVVAAVFGVQIVHEVLLPIVLERVTPPALNARNGRAALGVAHGDL